MRPVTLFTGQWADLDFETMCIKAKSFGYDGLELACWGDHFEVDKALESDVYCKSKWEVLQKHDLNCFAISNHLAGQAVCDLIDERHKLILPERIWGDGDPEGVRERSAEEMKNTARAARRLFDLAPDNVKSHLPKAVVNGFTGSSIWHMLYAFPPTTAEMIQAGFQDFADRWDPILDVFDEVNAVFALEVHPTEIAYDIETAQMAIDAVGGRKTFGFNYDPSHLGYQGVDYVGFLKKFADRIYHVHMKDVYWSQTPGTAGVFNGHIAWGDPRRYWDFRSLGHGCIEFEEIIRALNNMKYQGPLSVEWEDAGMDREHGAAEAADFVRDVDFPASDLVFDAAFSD